MKKCLLILLWASLATLSTATNVAVGRYSVADKQQVEFMSGNLEFTPSLFDWHIASNPSDTFGTKNIMHSATTNSIDLFSWSGSTYSNWGISAIVENLVFGGKFVDWGTNISFDVDETESWYTPTADEWNYLLTKRYNAASLNGRAVVNGTIGWIILADSSTQTLQSNYTLAQWNTLAQTGAIFLPMSGKRQGGQSVDTGAGMYWTSSAVDDKNAQAVCFSPTETIKVSTMPRCDGGAVRLAKRKSLIVTVVPGPCEEFIGWSDGKTDNPRIFKPGDPTDVEPILIEKIFTITATARGHGSVVIEK